MTRRSVSVLVLAGLIVALSGCNVGRMLDDYFANLGLNRLAVPRTDIAPGAIIVSNSRVNIYYGNINKFLDPPNQFSPKNVDSDAISQFQAVLQQYSGNSAVDGSLILKIADTILPVNLSAALKINGQVTVPQIQAQGFRLDPADIENLINDPTKGAAIRAWLQGQWDDPDDGDIYVAYETYSATSLKITSSNSSDISGDLSVGQTKVVQSGEIKADVTKASTTTLDITGTSLYVFAIKTGKIEPRAGGWRFKIATTVPGIVKGTPEVHAIPITTEGPLDLVKAPTQ